MVRGINFYGSAICCHIISRRDPEWRDAAGSGDLSFRRRVPRADVRAWTTGGTERDDDAERAAYPGPRAVLIVGLGRNLGGGAVHVSSSDDQRSDRDRRGIPDPT